MGALFDSLSSEVSRGLEGNNSGISIGYSSLDRYISVRKRIYTLLFGASGSGKSTLVHNAYILNPFDWWWKNRHTTKIKLKIVYFSMERSKTYVTAKKTGIIIGITMMPLVSNGDALFHVATFDNVRAVAEEVMYFDEELE